MQREGAECVGGDDGLQHHDLLLHQRRQQRAATLHTHSYMDAIRKVSVSAGSYIPYLEIDIVLI